MFYVRETPWHGLSTKVMNVPASEEALIVAGLNWNQAELKEIPCKKHLDLAVYCRIILAKTEDGIASTIVKRSMLNIG